MISYLNFPGRLQVVSRPNGRPWLSMTSCRGSHFTLESQAKYVHHPSAASWVLATLAALSESSSSCHLFERTWWFLHTHIIRYCTGSSVHKLNLCKLYVGTYRIFIVELIYVGLAHARPNNRLTIQLQTNKSIHQHFWLHQWTMQSFGITSPLQHEILLPSATVTMIICVILYMYHISPQNILLHNHTILITDMILWHCWFDAKYRVCKLKASIGNTTQCQDSTFSTTLIIIKKILIS